MGLARAARDAVGRARLCARRRALVLGQVPGGDLRGHELRAPGRGRSTVCCAGWAARAGRGGPTGWRPSSTPGTRSDHCAVRRRSPSTTASRSGSARRAGRSAKAWSSPRSTTSRARGGARRRSSSPGQAQADLDRWAIAVSDQRKRAGVNDRRARRAGAACCGCPGPRSRRSSRSSGSSRATAMVAFEGNRYSVPPGLVGQTVTVRARSASCTWRSSRPAGRRVARHRRAPAGAGQILQSAEHARLLGRPRCSTRSRPRSPAGAKQNRPPGTDAADARGRAAHTDAQGVSSSTSSSTRRSRGSPDEQARHLPAAALATWPT